MKAKNIFTGSLYSIFVAIIGVSFLLSSCKKQDVGIGVSSSKFFNKNIILNNGKLVESAAAFKKPVSKEIDESQIDKTILHLQILNHRDNFVDKICKSIGLPVWNQSLVFMGEDGFQTTITPIYNTGTAKVSGAVFGFVDKAGKFNTRIFARDVSAKFSDTARTIREVTKSTLNNLFGYFDRWAAVTPENIVSSKAPVDVLSDNIVPIVYDVCWYVLVDVYGQGTGVFQKQCHKEVFWGTMSEWDYYYNNGMDFIDPDSGYESYDEEEIEKAEENNWETRHIDTVEIAANPCLTSLVRNLMNNKQLDFAGIVKTMYGDAFGYSDYIPPFNLHITTVDNLPADVAASTRSSNYNSYMNINQNVFKNCSDLYAAATVIHEFIHAYMGNMDIVTGLGDSTVWNDFPSCFYAYQQTIYNQTGNYKLEPGNHEYMAAYLTGIMAHVLAEYDNNRHDYEYYWALSWGGLEETSVWKNYVAHPMKSEAEKGDFDFALTSDRIENIRTINHNEFEGNYLSLGKKHNSHHCY